MTDNSQKADCAGTMSQVIQVSSDQNSACAHVVYVGDCATQLYGD